MLLGRDAACLGRAISPSSSQNRTICSLILSLPSTFQLSARYQGFCLKSFSFSKDCWVIACVSSSRMRSVGDRILKKRPALNPLSLDANSVGLCAKGKRDRLDQRGNWRSYPFRTCLMRDGRTGRQAARMPQCDLWFCPFPHESSVIGLVVGSVQVDGISKLDDGGNQSAVS